MRGRLLWQDRAMVQRISSPVLVGRAPELARLAAALERAATGAPATVLVAGEAGVGKTRLLAEHGRRAEATGAYGRVPSPTSRHPPTSTVAPAASARRPCSASSRVLPTPASPATSTVAGAPVAARSSAAARDRKSVV